MRSTVAVTSMGALASIVSTEICENTAVDSYSEATRPRQIRRTRATAAGS